jgi:hypothetical protein
VGSPADKINQTPVYLLQQHCSYLRLHANHSTLLLRHPLQLQRLAWCQILADNPWFSLQL